jgi:glycosyltransferase involved in cell wall biosynthesis
MKLNARPRRFLFATLAIRTCGDNGSFKLERNPSLKRGNPTLIRRSLTDRTQRPVRKLMGVLRSVLPYAVVACVYLGTLVVCQMSRLAPRRAWTPTRRIVATATFFNSQWFLSHVIPLTRSGVDEVIVVTEQPLRPLARVRFWCPPRWLTRLVGRTVSKFASLLACGFYLRPDVFVGYHLFPGAISALIVARLLGRPACYQMTGGPFEVLGGGVYDENRLLAKLGRPSRLLERLAIAIVRQFDLVVVRGSGARAFLTDRDVHPPAVITGSVNFPHSSSVVERAHDLVFVGRLVPIKQPLQFVEIVADLRRLLPGVRAVVVGDGPLLNATHKRAIALGLEHSLHFVGKTEDVESILTRSKIFVLTSRSEGLSIAMAEAMAAGVVPIVANVGDLGDLVTDGVTGFLVTPNNVLEFVERAALLLQDSDLWARQSTAAMHAVRRHASVDVVAAKWTHALTRLVATSAAHRTGRTPAVRSDEP